MFKSKVKFSGAVESIFKFAVVFCAFLGENNFVKKHLCGFGPEPLYQVLGLYMSYHLRSLLSHM